MTPFHAENDDRTPELRRNVPGTIRWFPKVDGRNLALTSDPSFSVYSPAGSLMESGTTSRTSVEGYTRVDIPVAALATRACGYQVRLDFRAPGEAQDRVHVIPFDVVEWPLEIEVSLNDLLGIRPDIGRTLKRLGSHLSPPKDEKGMAAHYVNQAVTEADARLRSAIRRDSTANPEASRPSAILNRGPLTRFVRHEAMRLIFKAAGGTPTGEGAPDRDYQHAADEAANAWRGVGPLEYDTSGDLVADAIDANRTRVVTMRRSF